MKGTYKFMLKKIKTLILSLATMSLISLPMLAPAAVYAAVDTNDIQGSLACGSEFNVQSEPCTVDDGNAESTVNNMIKTGLNIFSIIVGIVAVIFIIIGGLRYITSGGEPSNTKTAKDTILFAIVGLIIVALAQIIVRFVLTKVNNSGG